MVCAEDKREQTEEKLKEISSSAGQAMKLSGIHFVDSIPRTAIGKPKRYLLKKMVMEDNLDSLTKQAKNSIDPSDIPSMVRNAVAKIAHVQPDEVKLSTKFLQEFTIDSSQLSSLHWR